MMTIAESLIDEGRLEGEKKGKVELIQHTLAYRFGQPLNRFDESLEALTRLSDAVYEVIDLPTFEALLQQLQEEMKSSTPLLTAE